MSQELLAIVEALGVLRCYLLSGKQLNFRLVTDNTPNTLLQTQPILSQRQAIGVSICNALISIGCIDLVGAMLLIL